MGEVVKPRILIDGIAISHPQPGGYKTYARNLVYNLSQLDGAYDYLLAIDRPAPVPRDWRGIIVGRPGSIGVVWREQVQLPRLAGREGAALLHAVAATGAVRTSVPVVVTLHDTIEFTDPLPRVTQTKRWAMRVYSRTVQAATARRAAHVITVSEYSKRQIIARFGLRADEVTVTLEAPDEACRPLPANAIAETARHKWGTTDFVFGMASVAPRKNTQGLMCAYAALPKDLRAKHPLVLVCTHRGLRDRLLAVAGELGIEGDLALLEAVSAEDLVILYNAAAVFVFPSLEEGFGLPPLEAMACGTPVIASNSSSLPEVVGEAGILVEPGNEEALTAAMSAILSDRALVASLRERGLARAATFSWRRTAEQTLEVYRRVLGGRVA